MSKHWLGYSADYQHRCWKKKICRGIAFNTASQVNCSIHYLLSKLMGAIRSEEVSLCLSRSERKVAIFLSF